MLVILRLSERVIDHCITKAWHFLKTKVFATTADVECDPFAISFCKPGLLVARVTAKGVFGVDGEAGVLVVKARELAEGSGGRIFEDLLYGLVGLEFIKTASGE